MISGGTLVVQGMARPFNSQPLIFELITEQGAVVGHQAESLLPLRPMAGISPLKLEIPYSVTQARGVRLVVHQAGDHIPGVMALNSVAFLQ